MYQSLHASQLSLRIGLAAVFLWFGVNKFIQPQYWVDAWMPQWAQHIAQAMGMGVTNAIFLIGIFEVLVAVSLVTGFFTRGFASAAIVFLLAVLMTSGLNEIVVRDIGLIASLAALVIWPQRRYA
ncbi:MAG: DoxX family membrane protein [Patescibacteria group bacterium]